MLSVFSASWMLRLLSFVGLAALSACLPAKCCLGFEQADGVAIVWATGLLVCRKEGQQASVYLEFLSTRVPAVD
jgi:hypothetical protein